MRNFSFTRSKKALCFWYNFVSQYEKLEYIKVAFINTNFVSVGCLCTYISNKVCRLHTMVLSHLYQWLLTSPKLLTGECYFYSMFEIEHILLRKWHECFAYSHKHLIIVQLYAGTFLPIIFDQFMQAIFHKYLSHCQDAELGCS